MKMHCLASPLDGATVEYIVEAGFTQTKWKLKIKSRYE